MKKQDIALTVLLFTCFGGRLDAGSHNDLQTNEQRLEAISVTTVHGEIAGKNPGFLSPNGGFFLTGDVLYWKAKQDNLDFAAEYSVNVANSPKYHRQKYPRTPFPLGLWLSYRCRVSLRHSG